MAISCLPLEIITNIFLRLPAKTLFNLRLVNRFWLQLISSQDFVRAHLKNSKENEALSDCRVIFATSFYNSILGEFSIASSFSKSSSISLVNLDHPKVMYSRLNVWLRGSCNGLVCMVLNTSNVFLWNPCTGKYKELRPLDVCKGRLLRATYGFGFDESNNDYKVVVLYDEVREGDKKYCCAVNSLKRNYWKRINHEFKDRVSGLGKLASGKVHWFADPEFPENWRKDIVSFDVGNEVFGTVEQPSYGDGRFQMTLGVLEGCICLLLNDKRTHADLWVMKEYGVKESWTKVVTISSINVHKVYDYLSPCSMLPNGEIFFFASNSFGVYNPKDCSFRLTGIVKNFCSEPVIYVPSLVSPVGTLEGEGQREQSS